MPTSIFDDCLAVPRIALCAALALGATACATSGPADDREEPSAAVLAALEAAARGEPYPDDLDAQTALSGRPMTEIQSAFDVRYYHLNLKVLPASQRIEGELTMRFVALSDLEAVELDLDPRLQINEVSANNAALSVDRRGGSFIVSLPAPLEAGETGSVTVVYAGQPHVAMAPPWHGGFVWSQVDGTPWFATAVQGDGCDLWWPCKDNFADKPDEGLHLAISAPKGISIASIGKLDRVEEGDDGFDTWQWTSRHPYSGYAVAINGGPYELIEQDYPGINGTTFPIQFWALRANADKARKLVENDAVKDLEFFEKLIGPYPWGDEKAGFVETPHLGMEHQTINGYGEQYREGKHGFDWLFHHELAHEWFGNVMTHAGPQDAWLHEGYGAYMQAVFAEETVGRMGYFDILYNAYRDNEHCDPVVNPAVGDAGEAFDNRDIYTKGSWLLHTLREYIGEEAFWAGTRRLVFDTDHPWSLPYPIESRYRSTEDFVRIMSEEAGEDVGWLVDTYLRETGMPELISTRDATGLTLRWLPPGDRPFPLPVEISIDGEILSVAASRVETHVAISPEARVLIDPNNKTLRALPIIGDCEAQTDIQIQRNIERFTRMAKEYGWQRK
ncbi:MAG: M1 family metallopeptidase [Congregibacter sp.]